MPLKEKQIRKKEWGIFFPINYNGMLSVDPCTWALAWERVSRSLEAQCVEHSYLETASELCLVKVLEYDRRCIPLYL